MLRNDDNPHGRIAAAEALVTLRGESARPAIEAAVAVEATWARATLEGVLRGVASEANGEQDGQRSRKQTITTRQIHKNAQ
jgi:hypothetical protein